MAVEWVLLGLGLALLAWRCAAAIRVYRDARQRGWPPLAGLGWALSATVYPDGYWWQARLRRLTSEEANRLLASTARAHHLSSVVNIRCPLCEAEITNALALTSASSLAIRPGARCQRCDFRLDACRHCAHFLPAKDGMSGQQDFTHGRCGRYRAQQPVREAAPNVADRLEAMGYDTLYAPKVIVDSFIPLDECRSFTLDSARLIRSGIPWLNRQRRALIRLRQNTTPGLTP